MRLKQLIISFFFLFVYSLSFAHSLMPHVNGFYSEHFPEVRAENENQHIHSHHKCDTPTENCITHNDHCDTGIIDLIVCFFSDSHYHHSNECDHQLVEHQQFKISPSNQFNHFNDGTVLIHLSFSLSNFNWSFNQCDLYQKGNLISLTTSQSRRGPPFLS